MSLVCMGNKFIALRKKEGFKFELNAEMVRRYTAYSEEKGDVVIRTARVVEWASIGAAPNYARVKFMIIRRFAQWLQLEEEGHEVPAEDALGVTTKTRNIKPLLTDPQLKQLLDLCLTQGSRSRLSSLTYYTAFGLMAAVGIRRSEVTSLRTKDYTKEGIEIWNSKFDKSRLVPIQNSVHQRLKRYLWHRSRVNTNDEHLFVLENGRPLVPNGLSRKFRNLCRKIEPWVSTGEKVPSLHSLRHRFIVRSIESAGVHDWDSVGRHMAALRVYVGHSKFSHTYWYLRGTPGLFEEIAELMDGTETGRLEK